MKRILLGMTILVGAGALAATVSNVAVNPTGAGTGPVEVTYDLDAAAIVTFDVLTNGVSIGQGAANAGGDANRYTLAGTGKRIFWMPHRDWEGHDLAGVQVQVKAWDVDAPPPYMVAEIHGGDVQYYASADLVPDGGVTNRKYKTSHLVMVKVPAKDVLWTMGVYGGERLHCGARGHAPRETLVRLLHGHLRVHGGAVHVRHEPVQSYRHEGSGKRGLLPAHALLLREHARCAQA